MKTRKESTPSTAYARIAAAAIAGACWCASGASDYVWTDGHYTQSLVNPGLPVTINADDIVWALGKTNTNYYLYDPSEGLKVINNADILNNGQFNWHDNQWALYLTAGSTFANYGTMNFAQDSDIRYAEGGGGNWIYNMAGGTIRKTDGLGALAFRSSGILANDMALTNHGTLDAQVGSMVYGFTRQYFLDGTRFAGGAHIIDSLGDINYSSHFSGNVAVDSGTTVRFSGSEWSGFYGDNATVIGAFRLDRGVMHGQWNIAHGSEMHVDYIDGNQGFSQAQVINDGVISINDHFGLFGSSVTNNGKVTINGDFQIDRFGNGNASSFINNGELIKTSGAGEAWIARYDDVTFLNNGLIQVKEGSFHVGTGSFAQNMGTIRVDPGALFETRVTLENLGILAGYGTIRVADPYGLIINKGVIDPGGSIGSLTLSTSLRQDSEGSIRLEIEGIAEGQFDRLTVLGDANLAGTIDIYRSGGYVPTLGDSIRFLTANSICGTPNIVLHGFDPGTVFGFDINGGTAQLTVNAVPEPASAAVLLFLGLGVLKKRRNR